ncbi:hypothetical protein BCR33DRAFT_723086 [Rhizoclosmatium globosum]|uniref:Uncharacterized protein n=1 Tax=Rhizoclosmatium globosum TaxID=329046 RepID=A0A1Y2BGC8_9FUNG|nr:hypothetical protein BCR33DRAFT_723086 [Rhizoclosmatium globosum]|eukprot:ORY33874.1 hypothetical protein BCR33DRAFT_723086 [Rhizoclosmatium globosum]
MPAEQRGTPTKPTSNDSDKDERSCKLIRRRNNTGTIQPPIESGKSSPFMSRFVEYES